MLGEIAMSYIQLKRSKTTDELMKYPSAFMLLTQIALRARRTDSLNINDLKVGEALVGDFESIGLTRQEYRTALKKRLLISVHFYFVKIFKKSFCQKTKNKVAKLLRFQY